MAVQRSQSDVGKPGTIVGLPQPEAARSEVGGVDGFLTSFDALAKAVRRARGAQAQSREETLTLSQYALLEALSSRETARVRELASEAGITPSTATRILDALERKAIVSRTRAQDDRRGVTVRLTDLGREALSGQDAWLRGRQRAFFDGLPPTERELAPDLLVRLAELIDELAAGPA
jgi:MarR family transcriptional regulator, organic hydroperoxide resistance regulator